MSVKELLEAGAVLPLGAEDAGEEAVPLTARVYRHPALEGRTVVRLVDAESGEGVDRAAAFLGLEPADEPEAVGIGRRCAASASCACGAPRAGWPRRRGWPPT